MSNTDFILGLKNQDLASAESCGDVFKGTLCITQHFRGRISLKSQYPTVYQPHNNHGLSFIGSLSQLILANPLSGICFKKALSCLASVELNFDVHKENQSHNSSHSSWDYLKWCISASWLPLPIRMSECLSPAGNEGNVYFKQTLCLLNRELLIKMSIEGWTQ